MIQYDIYIYIYGYQGYEGYSMRVIRAIGMIQELVYIRINIRIYNIPGGPGGPGKPPGPPGPGGPIYIYIGLSWLFSEGYQDYQGYLRVIQGLLYIYT